MTTRKQDEIFAKQTWKTMDKKSKRNFNGFPDYKREYLAELRLMRKERSMQRRARF